MGFFDEFQDTSGGNWIKADEKQTLIEDATPLTITSVKAEDTAQFGERYICGVEVAGEERLLSFPRGTVESRDRMLDAMLKWLDDPTNEAPVVVLEKVGRSIIIKPAS